MSYRLFLTVLSTLAVIFAASTLALEVAIDDGNYILNYKVQGGLIVVNITAKTEGYIGFGISPDGSMSGADIVIAGWAGAGYINDYSGSGNGRPNLDTEQNVLLVSASESANLTNVVFVRALDTGDMFQDLAIENYNQSIIWAIGLDDQVAYHQDKRGSIRLNLLAE